MAQVFPNLENIKRLKVKPTEGEWFLINYLIENLPDEIEIYFQPFLNGDMPDIILMQKEVGVTIIEVKDWNLDFYRVDENNRWHLKQNNALLKSPFQQVFAYKNNMFNLHIDGLLKEKIRNQNFYQRINTYVYFYNATKKRINDFFDKALVYYTESIIDCNRNREQFTTHQAYEKKLNYIKQKKSKIERDLRLSVGNNNLTKIALPQGRVLFTEVIYNEFHRYLQPPYHTLEQGIEIQYTKDQEKHIISQNKHQKILGVAGSGKTLVLAKKAVNAHKRHDDMVLILTYNITLTRYIHDRISDVRENFSWKYFYITNYHLFIKQLLNNLNIAVEIDDNAQKNIDGINDFNEKQNFIEAYFETEYFSNKNLFESIKENIPQYKTILIDEIQDYKSSWIEIIKTYILKENGEFVLFGDEKQNIYDRQLDQDKRPNTKIIGRWNKLTESIRHKNWDGSQILPLVQNFQKEFLKEKYYIDENPLNKPIQPSLVEDKNQILFKIEHYEKNELDILVQQILLEIRQNHIQNDDIVILGSKIDTLKEVDYLIRTTTHIKTLTTFETKEMGEYVSKQDTDDIRKIKKIAFNHHSGKLKISTIHSFKGYEADTVFLIVEEDSPEIVYTAITRSLFNIMVFTTKQSKYNTFFTANLETSNVDKNENNQIDSLEVSSFMVSEALESTQTEIADEVDSETILETLTPVSKTGLALGGLGLLFGLPF